MCPKPAEQVPVANPANYKPEEQGDQFTWTMTDENGKTTTIKKPTHTDTPTETKPASTGIKTSTFGGRTTGSH